MCVGLLLEVVARCAFKLEFKRPVVGWLLIVCATRMFAWRCICGVWPSAVCGLYLLRALVWAFVVSATTGPEDAVAFLPRRRRTSPAQRRWPRRRLLTLCAIVAHATALISHFHVEASVRSERTHVTHERGHDDRYLLSVHGLSIS